MYNVIQLFIKHGAHILFVVLEVICFTLIINYNKAQKDIFINSSNVLAGKITEQRNKILEFTNLRSQNDSLMRENANLIENLIAIEYATDAIPESDSLLSKFSLIPTRVINSTVYLRNNYFTLDKGSRQGVQPEMGVIGAHQGLIGIVKNVSDNYAGVISLLNSYTRISCSVKGRNGHGTLEWRNSSPLKMNITGFPKHDVIAVGDTVITSGYSTIFPRGLLIGVIEDFTVPSGSNNYNITVKLFNDLTSTKYAYVIQNRFAAEQIKLEKELMNE